MSEISETVESTASPKSESDVAPPQSAGASITGAATAALEEVSGRVGSQRWIICGLLFFASAINYIDRQVIAILKPTLQKEFGWSDIDYGWIIFAFTTAYALGFIFVGRLMDKIGTKRGFTLSIILWSLGAILHAWAVGAGEIMSPILTPIISGIVSIVNAVIVPLGLSPWTIALSV
jgi:MFS transporter, ACS family, hexuronate transporter